VKYPSDNPRDLGHQQKMFCQPTSVKSVWVNDRTGKTVKTINMAGTNVLVGDPCRGKALPLGREGI
jgi:hypothetical protein